MVKAGACQPLRPQAHSKAQVRSQGALASQEWLCSHCTVRLSLLQLLVASEQNQMHKIPGAWLRKGRTQHPLQTLPLQPTHRLLLRTATGSQQPLNSSPKEDHNTSDNRSRGHVHPCLQPKWPNPGGFTSQRVKESQVPILHSSKLQTAAAEEESSLASGKAAGNNLYLSIYLSP